MISFIKEHPKAVLVAVIVHLVFVAVLVVSFKYSEKIFDSPPQVEIVEAVVVDEAKVQRELKKIQDAERRREEKLQQAKEERKREEKRLADLKKKREVEKKRQAEAEKKRKADLEKKRQAEQARLEKLKAQQKAEQERLAKLAAEKKALAEAKRKEEDRLKALEAQRAKEEEQRRQADQARREKELKERLEAEQKRLEAEHLKRENEARAARRLTEIDKYTQRIYAEIYRTWAVPIDSRRGLITEVKVRLIPSGDVVAVDVVKSSGDPVFDKSVTNAIQKASPLPVPPVESGLFEEFRDLILQLKRLED